MRRITPSRSSPSRMNILPMLRRDLAEVFGPYMEEDEVEPRPQCIFDVFKGFLIESYNFCRRGRRTKMEIGRTRTRFLDTLEVRTVTRTSMRALTVY